MTLKQLKAFLVLARTLNYANAANELCLSQSALSLSIKTLEEELGGKLFKRNTRRVEITLEGQSLIPYAKKLLANWEDMEKDVKQRFKLNRGTLNIASMPFATHAVLPEVMHDFAQQHPNISFSIHDITNEKIIEKVQEGIFEIGICFEPKANDQLIFQPIFNEDFLALLPKHHVLAKQKSVTWLELCSCPFVTLQNPSIIRHVIEEHCAALQVVLDLKVECHQISSLSHFVAYGMGVSAIPRHFQKFIDLEKNVLVEIEDNQAQLAVGIIYKKDYELSNMSSQFIETTLWHHF
ncbi:LysR family carnitine catabolism transcriptional activator [Acinetobacter johnsonii]|uniref:LysR substrate-binding domain-containing protein n=1 Tax=Acinetobacter johnsonii TaxID=40214 RepID=A0A5C0U9L1_ACIJO|nr:LysR family transcriptional regulator [Acinetobacter johnsonii]MBB4810808.1 LysR family carnitine catabolism transcriptional activator [Acinetobacter johnsonii]MDH0836742.1 LysR substrate-binding domain-containing protein [Acinetobacter johnsonii]MDH0840235.1 LysR substrate-binding domain-containing protein [Acinetobacter johnsonii]MDH1705228.1 LysR substrate-binding domain-containing protein [Acinetobacter johnsonii]MDH2173810.1 LysR substrate-binding domain-containing protein [Acinetobact